MFANYEIGMTLKRQRLICLNSIVYFICLSQKCKQDTHHVNEKEKEKKKIKYGLRNDRRRKVTHLKSLKAT